MADAGMPVPAIENRPSVIGFEWLWEAFVVLGSCRVNGFELGSIPWTAVEMYAHSLMLDEEEKWLLHGVVSYLDQVFIDYQRNKSDKARQAAQIKNKVQPQHRRLGLGGR